MAEATEQQPITCTMRDVIAICFRMYDHFDAATQGNQSELHEKNTEILINSIVGPKGVAELTPAQRRFAARVYLARGLPEFDELTEPLLDDKEKAYNRESTAKIYKRLLSALSDKYGEEINVPPMKDPFNVIRTSGLYYDSTIAEIERQQLFTSA
jgi:hypothetical protein